MSRLTDTMATIYLFLNQFQVKTAIKVCSSGLQMHSFSPKLCPNSPVLSVFCVHFVGKWPRNPPAIVCKMLMFALQMVCKCPRNACEMGPILPVFDQNCELFATNCEQKVTHFVCFHQKLLTFCRPKSENC